MLDFEYKPPTNQTITKKYVYGQLLISKRWYVRPVDWCGCWTQIDDKSYLSAGNTEIVFDTEQECIDYINKKEEQKC